MVRITRARESDAEVLAHLGEATFVETFAKDNRKEDMELYVANTFGLNKQMEEIRDSKRRIEIAWVDESPAGYLHLVNSAPDPSVVGDRPIEILRLYVESRWHGKGVGAALMERAIKIAQVDGFRTVWLGVWERNFRAQAFYAKYGFVTVGRHIFQLGLDEQTDLIMVRSV